VAAKIIFDNILAHAKSGKALAIFDLDSTLFDVSHRTQAILNDFIKLPDIYKNFKQEVHFLSQQKIKSTDWGLHQPLERAGF